MKLLIKQILPRASEIYPYTHRIEFYSEDVDKYDEVEQWLEEQQIPHTMMYLFQHSNWEKHFAVYVNDRDATRITLRWLG